MTADGPGPIQFGHERILASAGAGKTYQLTSRYLALVDAGADPAGILASTFTRLAAGEIRNRILMRLAEAADDAKKRSELAASLGHDALSRARVVELLAGLARRIHRMNIRTLDSFLAGIVRAFALELGVPPGARPIEETEAAPLRTEAIARMLDEREPQSLIELLRLLTQGSSERGVTATIDGTVVDLFELNRQAAPAAWACLPEISGRMSRSRLAKSIEHLQTVPPTGGKRFITAHTRDCAEAVRHRWDGFLSGGLAKRILMGETTYYSKPIDPALVHAYLPLVAHARAELVSRFRDQSIATGELLTLYGGQYERIKHQRGVMTFADLVAVLDRAERLGTLDEICYRIDATIEHLLLDEFQDTSVSQWRSIEPIVRELVSDETSGRSFFCVGDVKQSIYGWRNAEPEVMAALPTILFGEGGEDAMHDETLAKSWRSSPIIMEAVNRVFHQLSECPGLDDHASVVEKWVDEFPLHTTQHEKLPGYACLRTIVRGRNAAEREPARLRAAAELAADLHRRAPDLKIGILTRKNAEVSRLLFELGPTQLDVSASGPGGGPLTDAPAVNAVLDLMRLADQPDDTVAAFNVVKSPLGGVVKLSDHCAKPQRRSVARRMRRAVAERGYANAIARLVKRLAPACDPRELRRLKQLVEVAESFDPRRSLRPADFVAHVEARSVADIRPAPVQVMTVHKAKGLEFDIVILPALEAKLTGSRTPAVVFERDGITGPVTRICRYMKKELRQLVPEVQPLFDAHEDRTVRESLCLLYVGMTRAKQGLYMLIDPPGLKRNSDQVSETVPKSTAGILRSTLTEELPEPESIVYEAGDEDWIDAAGEEATPAPAPLETAPATIELAPPPPPGGAARGLIGASPSAHEETQPLASRLRAPDEQALDRGRAIHALFEQVKWLEEFDLDNDTLIAIALGHAPRRGIDWAQQQVASFRAMLERADVRAALSRGERDAARFRVECEQPFARLVEGRPQRGEIDRLVIELDAHNQPVGATIIDFKTDQVTADTIDERAWGYEGQLKAYRAAAAERLKIDASAIRLDLLFVELGTVVRLDA